MSLLQFQKPSRWVGHISLKYLKHQAHVIFHSDCVLEVTLKFALERNLIIAVDCSREETVMTEVVDSQWPCLKRKLLKE